MEQDQPRPGLVLGCETQRIYLYSIGYVLAIYHNVYTTGADTANMAQTVRTRIYLVMRAEAHSYTYRFQMLQNDLSPLGKWILQNVHTTMVRRGASILYEEGGEIPAQ